MFDNPTPDIGFVSTMETNFMSPHVLLVMHHSPPPPHKQPILFDNERYNIAMDMATYVKDNMFLLEHLLANL